jgi:hypothetical protein
MIHNGGYMAEEYTKEVISATNQIHSILLQSYEPDEEALQKVFAIGCHTLEHVTTQMQVLNDLKRMAFTQERYWREYKEICGNVDHFNDEFCQIERRVLIKAGVSSEAVDLLLAQAKALRKIIKDLKINPEVIFGEIEKLRDVTCEIAKSLHYLPLDHREKQKFKNKVKKLGAGIGGIAIVGVNASALALSWGMSGPGTSVSTGFGGGLIGSALTMKD